MQCHPTPMIPMIHACCCRCSVRPYPEVVKDLCVNAWPTLSTNAGKKGGTYLVELVALKGDAKLLEYMVEAKPDVARWHFEHASKHAEKDRER